MVLLELYTKALEVFLVAVNQLLDRFFDLLNFRGLILMIEVFQAQIYQIISILGLWLTLFRNHGTQLILYLQDHMALLIDLINVVHDLLELVIQYASHKSFQFLIY